ILDMGMALLHGADKDSVHGAADGGLMGTPDYMAPEQALDFRQVDIRADLYSLGCTFYYMLTGRPPFDEYPLMRKMMMHQQGTVRPVWELRATIPPEMDAIVQKLLAKKPEDRYQTPAALADALSALLGDEKAADSEKNRETERDRVKAEEESPSLTFRVSPEPHSANAPSSIAPSRSAPARTVPADRLAATRSEAGDRLATARSETPDRSAATPSGARDAEPPAPESGDPRRGPGAPKKMAVLQGPAGGASALAFGPNRDVLAAGGLQGALRFWEFHGTPRERIIVQTFETGVWSLAFSPDQRTLAWGSGSLDGLICLGDLTDPTLNRMALLHRHQAPVDALAFSGDGKMLATGSRDQTVRWWELIQTEDGLVEGPKDPTV